MNFHKTTVNKLYMKTKPKKSLGTFITKQNTIAKISQKKLVFSKRTLHKGSIVPEHLIFLLLLQHSNIDIYVKTVKLIKKLKSTQYSHNISLRALPIKLHVQIHLKKKKNLQNHI